MSFLLERPPAAIGPYNVFAASVQICEMFIAVVSLRLSSSDVITAVLVAALSLQHEKYMICLEESIMLGRLWFRWCPVYFMVTSVLLNITFE